MQTHLPLYDTICIRISHTPLEALVYANSVGQSERKLEAGAVMCGSLPVWSVMVANMSVTVPTANPSQRNPVPVHLQGSAAALPHHAPVRLWFRNTHSPKATSAATLQAVGTHARPWRCRRCTRTPQPLLPPGPSSALKRANSGVGTMLQSTSSVDVRRGKGEGPAASVHACRGQACLVQHALRKSP